MTQQLSRRALLQGIAAAGLPLSLLTRAATPQGAMASSYAPYDGPFNARFSGELQAQSLPIEGRLPTELRGTLYRNGPARMRLGTTEYRHWFDGDGMVQAFALADGRARHRGVLLRTPKLVEEEAAGRFLYPAFGTNFPDAHDARTPDSLNTANINLLAMKGGRELYALWEGGSALQIDPQTLAAGGFKTWSPETAGAPFSAHPRISPDGTVWSFGYMAGSGKLVVYEITPDGQLRRQSLLAAPQADMVHDFAVTTRHLVFLLMPLQYDREPKAGTSFADRFDWNAQAPMIALVVDKSDFSTRRFELPNGGVFHLGNAWEDGGTIRLSYVRHPNLAQTLRSLRILQDTREASAGPTALVEVQLDLASGRASQQKVDGMDNVEFPRFDTRRTGEKTAMSVLMQRSAAMPPAVRGFDTVLKLREGRIQRHVYGGNWIAEEHLFVPRSASARPDDGWILGTAYDWAKERTALSVFDAGNVAAGPLARIHLPYGLPLGLHGQFVQALS
ncbi:carotenoid oxygenase family protein [Polaromonas sp.]|uniref:carotenoid oxygenase family protein n=1 Tax=Polaromonas sp. TaxID=1869339 RepID=UPI003263229E